MVILLDKIVGRIEQNTPRILFDEKTITCFKFITCYAWKMQKIGQKQGILWKLGKFERKLY